MAKIISDKGSPMMVLNEIRRDGDQLEITGQMMGAWPSKMYITLDEFGDFLRIMLRPAIISYVLLYPYFLIRKKLKSNSAE